MNTEQAPVLDVSRLRVAFDGVEVVHGIDLTISPANASPSSASPARASR